MDEQRESILRLTKEVEEQYKLLHCERSRISNEIAQLKRDEDQINQKLLWFPHLDRLIEGIMFEIKNYERRDLDNITLSLPISSVPRTSVLYRLTGKDAQTPDLKRCQKRLIKKGRMDIQYLEEIQEEHISSMNSSESTYRGTQELNDMIESMVQRIKHGNKKRADEMKIYKELSNFKETKESYIAPQRSPHWYQREQRRKIDIDQNRSFKRTICIRLDDIENLKRELIGRKSRVRRLKAELEYVRRNINYSHMKLENVDLKIHKAYKLLMNLEADQKKETLQETLHKKGISWNKTSVRAHEAMESQQSTREDYKKINLGWLD